MQLTSAEAVWKILNRPAPPYPALRRNLECEVVVVGGGITGALSALYLTEAGIDTVLLEKREVGMGSTSGSTGLLQYEVDVPLRGLIRRIGRPAAVLSYQLCGQAVSELEQLVHRLRIDCGFQERPSLLLGRQERDRAGLREEARLRREIGFEVELWSRGEVKRHFGFDRPAALFSALGAEVDPHRLTLGILKAAPKLQVFARTEMKELKPTSKGVRLRTRNGQTIKARRAVVAAGYESRPYLRQSAGTLQSTFALISEPLRGIPARWHRRALIWETGSPYLYLRTTSDNRIIVGGEDVSIVQPAKREKLVESKTRALLDKFHALFPETELPVAFSWAGTFGSTKDGIAYIGGTHGLPHVYFALGYGGNGITYSLLAAQIIRDDFLGNPRPEAQLFRFGR